MDFQIDSHFEHGDTLEQVLQRLGEQSQLIKELKCQVAQINQQLLVLLDLQKRRSDAESQSKPRVQRRLWNSEENRCFLKAVMRYGLNRHKEIAAELPDREANNVASHLQKMQQKWLRAVSINPNLNYALIELRVPDRVPLDLVVEGIAYIRSHMNLAVSVEFDPCASFAAELINNRVAEAHGIETERVKFIASNVRMARSSENSYELGAKQIGLQPVRGWSTQPGFWQRAHQLTKLCMLSDDYRFYIWYIAQGNGLDPSLICADFVCAIIETLNH